MSNTTLKEFKLLALSGSNLEQDKNRDGVSQLGSSGIRQEDEQDSRFVVEGEKGVSALHGFKEPPKEIQQEQYKHRIVAELRSQGKTLQEISEITGYNFSWLSVIVKQPWCVKYVMERIHANGGQAVLEYMKSKAMPAAETVVDGFMDESMDDRRDRVNAANSVLDRVFGKPAQTIINHKGSDLNKLTDDELAALAQLPKTN